jgi:hypothetical protein
LIKSEINLSRSLLLIIILYMDSLLKPLNPKKASFGRHETFALRYSRLTKGFQAFEKNKSIFSSHEATIELGVGKNDVLKAYIPTSRAVQTLDKIAQTFNQKAVPRAWSLVGPYGSGKSSFAAFLAHLLENQERTNSELAEEILQRHNPEVAEKFTACTHNSNAYCIVLLTGSPESLSKRFVQALYQTSVSYFEEIEPKGMPSIVHDLEQARHQARTTSEIVKLLKKLREAVSQVSGKGILIVIDELGKFLEYEARHQGSNDIFLLQALGELCVEGGDANILLVVLMHQAFEQYSKGLAEAQKQEWLKVPTSSNNKPMPY